MAYDHDNTFFRKWLLQSPAGLDAALGIPAADYIQAAHPADDEWAAINTLSPLLGLSAEQSATLAASPFLRLHPEASSRMSNDGEAPGYRASSSGTINQAGGIRRRFEINIRDVRSPIADGIRRIADVSNYGDQVQQIPVLILDFCFPEVNDKIIAIAQNLPPYTVRLGLISDVGLSGPEAGYPGTDRVSLGSGFSFTFTESTLRRVT